jgi:hypothetical protein
VDSEIEKAQWTKKVSSDNRLSIHICTLNLINASSNFDQIQLSMKFSFHYLFSSVCQFPVKQCSFDLTLLVKLYVSDVKSISD